MYSLVLLWRLTRLQEVDCCDTQYYMTLVKEYWTSSNDGVIVGRFVVPLDNKTPCSLCDGDSDVLRFTTNENVFALDDGADIFMATTLHLLAEWNFQIPSVVPLR